MATQTHAGGCHCGAVRFRATLDLSAPVIDCNCSICRMKGLLLSAVAEDALEIEQGADDLSDYRFAGRKIAHRSCRTCGVEVFGQFPGQGAAINVRTLDGVDIDGLTRKPFDGASL